MARTLRNESCPTLLGAAVHPSLSTCRPTPRPVFAVADTVACRSGYKNPRGHWHLGQFSQISHLGLRVSTHLVRVLPEGSQAMGTGLIPCQCLTRGLASHGHWSSCPCLTRGLVSHGHWSSPMPTQSRAGRAARIPGRSLSEDAGTLRPFPQLIPPRPPIQLAIPPSPAPGSSPFLGSSPSWARSLPGLVTLRAAAHENFPTNARFM